MSSPIASRWIRSTRRTARRAGGPSLREVCLVGDTGSVVDRREATDRTIRRDGRSYRVAASDGPSEPDPRRYVHLVAVGSDPAEV